MRLEATLSEKLFRYPLPRLAVLELSTEFDGLPSLTSMRHSLVYLNWTISKTLQELPPWIILKEFGEVIIIQDELRNESERDLAFPSSKSASSFAGLGINANSKQPNIYGLIRMMNIDPEIASLANEPALERLVSLQLDGEVLGPFSPTFFSKCQNLKHLEINCGFEVPLESLPSDLVTLRVNHFRDDDLINLLVRCTSLTSLTVGELQTQPPSVIEALPRTLKSLYIRVYQIPYGLPSSLKELRIVTDSYDPAAVNDLELLPRDLEVLDINFNWMPCDQILIGQFLPPNLKQLVLDPSPWVIWPSEIGATFPKSLTFLSLSGAVSLPDTPEKEQLTIFGYIWNWLSKKKGHMDTDQLAALKQVMSRFPANCVCDVRFHLAGDPSTFALDSYVAQQSRVCFQSLQATF